MMPVVRVHCKRLVSLLVSKAGGRGRGGTYHNTMQLLEIYSRWLGDRFSLGNRCLVSETNKELKIPITSTDLS